MTPSQQIVLRQIRTTLLHIHSLAHQSLYERHSHPMLTHQLVQIRTMIRRRRGHTADLH